MFLCSCEELRISIEAENMRQLVTTTLFLLFIPGNFGNDFNCVCSKNKDKLSVVYSPEYKNVLEKENFKTGDLINSQGYSFEEHQIETEDGYFLSVQRMKGGNKRPVLLLHAFLLSSTQWFLQPGNFSLPILLANEGHDIWIANHRGTTYSRGCNSSKKIDYWDFEIFEVGNYDIPAIIDHILKINSAFSSLYFVGHSIGFGEVLITLSTRPQLNSKFTALFGLAPGSVFHDKEPLLQTLLARVVGNTEIFGGSFEFPTSQFQKAFSKIVRMCKRSDYANNAICYNLYQMLFGGKICERNRSLKLSALFTTTPDSTSFKMFSNWGQYVISKRFHMHDYGKEQNLRKYGSPEAPDYDLKLIDVPMYVYWGGADKLDVNHKNLQILLKNLKTPVIKEVTKIPAPCWGHLDFILREEAKDLVYNRIIDVMKLSE